MVKIYNNVGRTYVKGYGHMPVVFRQNGYGQLTGKVVMGEASKLAQSFVPQVKRTFKRFEPHIPETIMEAGRSALETGQDIVEDVKEGARISAKAEKLLKKMASRTKTTAEKIKNVKLPKDFPKAISSKLSKKQKDTLNKMAQSTLTKLLKRGSGLKLL